MYFPNVQKSYHIFFVNDLFHNNKITSLLIYRKFHKVQYNFRVFFIVFLCQQKTKLFYKKFFFESDKKSLNIKLNHLMA